MRKSVLVITLSITVAMMASMFIIACGGGGGGGGSTSNPAAYPNSADSYEGSGDDTAMTASSIELGQTQVRTIYPMGDVDWVAVDLTAGTEYEFSANNLAAATDAFMYLFSTDGTTQLDYEDDYISLDPRILFTPGVTGTYYLKVMSYGDAPDGGDYTEKSLLAYTLGAREFTDGDGDDYSPYYDCNDADDTIYPGASEVPGDGIDQNCSGVDEIPGTTPDPAEDDDDMASAVTMIEPTGDPWEIQYRSATFVSNARTIDAAGEKDWFSVSVPAHGLIEFTTSYDDLCLNGTVYESDGVTIFGTGTGVDIANTTSSPMTYFMVYEGCGGTSTGYYVPSILNYGVDMDGDDYYTQDWDTDRDCDDTDDTIYPGAVDAGGDGIDQDCDGSDG